MTKPRAAWIVGTSGNFWIHDLSFALVDDSGDVRFMAEEERFNRVRHNRGALPSAAGLEHGLRRLDVDPEAVQAIGVGFQPELFPAPYIADAFRRVEDVLFEHLRLGSARRLHYPHHTAHAAASFFPSRFEEAAVLTVDGEGEAATVAAHVGRGTSVTPLWERRAHSIGVLYLRITQWLGLGIGGDEGKTMGLAPYGTPSYTDLFERELVTWDVDDGSFEIAPRVLDARYSLRSIVDVLGPRREPDEELTRHHKDVAATIQHVTEEILLGLCRRLRRETSAEFACLGGGVALNSVANGKIEEAGVFREVYIPPWAGDAGLAIGAALLAHAELGDRSARRERWRPTPFLGRSFDTDDCRRELDRRGVSYTTVESPELVAARRVAGGRVVGWCHGSAEVGPRALGHRSILANPMVSTMAQIVNERVKFREPWRPFAPSVLDEDAERYFDVSAPAPYMISVYRVRHEWREVFPAVTHVDGTARLQRVTASADEGFHRFLLRLKELTGHGIVLNTSLNVKGEPIVNGPGEAIDLFLSTDLDTLVLDRLVLDKETSAYPTVPRINLQRRQLRALESVAGRQVVVLVTSEYLHKNRLGSGRSVARRAFANVTDVARKTTVISDGDEREVRAALPDVGAVVRFSREAERDDSLTALVLLAETALFDVDGLSKLRALRHRWGTEAFVAVLDVAVHPFDEVQPFADLWRAAFLLAPAPDPAQLDTLLGG
jgi:carbamoyltransferase